MKLKNGADVIRIAFDKKVVLAYFGGHQPYVTWQMDDAGNCFWGHYFENKRDAEEDFKNRRFG